MSAANEINEWVRVYLFPGVTNPRCAGFRFYDTKQEAAENDTSTTTFVIPWKDLPEWVQGRLGALNILVLSPDRQVAHVRGVGGKAMDMLWVDYDDDHEFVKAIKKKEAPCGAR